MRVTRPALPQPVRRHPKLPLRPSAHRRLRGFRVLGFISGFAGVIGVLVGGVGEGFGAFFGLLGRQLLLVGQRAVKGRLVFGIGVLAGFGIG